MDVTVVVPVYNSEQYIERCLNSLIHQTYDRTKFEILVIDDYSRDKSKEIIKKYEEKYSCIKTRYMDKNYGVSHARNIGIKEARGKYIMFCDSDDYYESDAVSVFMQIINKYDADFVMANYCINKNNKDIKINSTKFFLNMKMKKEEIISYMTLTSSAKIIRKSLFMDSNIFYPEDIKRCEELTVIPVVAYLAKKPIAIDNQLYHYYQRKKSVSNSNKNKNVEDFDFFNITFNRFLKYVDEDKYKEEIRFRAIDHLIYGKTLVMLKAGIKRKKIINEIKIIEKKYPKIYKNKYLKEYSKAKRLFIKLIEYRMFFTAKMFARLHQIVTG